MRIESFSRFHIYSIQSGAPARKKALKNTDFYKFMRKVPTKTKDKTHAGEAGGSNDLYSALVLKPGGKSVVQQS